MGAAEERDERAEEQERECTCMSKKAGVELLRLGSWNVHTLSDYKQSSLLELACGLELDLLALCETHLVNSEQMVQWAQAVAAEGQYTWFGRAAVRLNQAADERGRGSGGVGILVKKEWASFVVPMPDCVHDCLHFVRLTLPKCPFVLFFGVAYAVPIGSARYGDVPALLTELEERVTQYQLLGAVVVAGDFNIHIACHPSTVISAGGDEYEYESGPVGPLGVVDTVLERVSVDTLSTSRNGEAGAVGARFMERMDGCGMVVLNGLRGVGDGRPAEATFGVQSVIDLFLIDGGHWRHAAHSVHIVPAARAEVDSDHQLVCSSLWYEPAAARSVRAEDERPAAMEVDLTALLISSTRYRTNDRGDRSYWSDYKAACKPVLDELTTRWKENQAAGEEPAVEEAWAEFTERVRFAAHFTIGVREDRAGPPRSGSERHSKQLQRWKQERRQVESARAALGPGSEQRPQLDRECLSLTTRIHNLQRREVRQQQERELTRVQRLKPKQMREHWQALKRIGNLQPPPQAVPPTALDTASVEQEGAAAVRTV